MCGIVAVIGSREAAPLLLEGLRQLEYRGYDSAGIATVNGERQLSCLRAEGKLVNLTQRFEASGAAGQCGIGHTRWATHGKPEERNAHPHLDGPGRVAVVQNGIIENFRTLREELQAEGVVFRSETDTEVIPHLLARQLARLAGEGRKPSGALLLQAVQQVLPRLQGAYALAVVWAEVPGALVVARKAAPLLIGLGEGEFLCASDTPALAGFTRTILPMEDGEVALLTPLGIELYDAAGQRVQRSPSLLSGTEHVADKRSFRHFMLKEIHEQPETAALWVARHLPEAVAGQVSPLVALPLAAEVFEGVERIQILACGTSYYAGLTARYWMEAVAGIPCSVEIASEYRYRDAYADPKQLIVTISQSGETLDTMEALKYAKSLGQDKTLSICNVQESAIPRASRMVFYTRAGAEIGVASTKAFTTQLIALFALVGTLAKLHGRLDVAHEKALLDDLRLLPGSVQAALNLEPQIIAWSGLIAPKHHALFLGRGLHYPIALEGALKLKEISYIHAEAYPAGELKHGPLALVDADMPVVVIAPNDSLLEKVKSNIQEVRARGGEMFVFADADSHFSDSDGVHVIRTPRHVGLLSPIVHSIPVQLLAYHTAIARGTDVDKPRNLAKSVTVE